MDKFRSIAAYGMIGLTLRRSRPGYIQQLRPSNLQFLGHDLRLRTIITIFTMIADVHKIAGHKIVSL